jgi:hypothetical protein
VWQYRRRPVKPELELAYAILFIYNIETNYGVLSFPTGFYKSIETFKYDLVYLNVYWLI